MIYIYTKQNTKRLRYVAKVLFERILLAEYEITTDESIFAKEAAVINYSNNTELGGTLMIPAGLIEQTGYSQANPIGDKWGDIPTLYPTDSEIPFDLFSAAFFMLSRYEEYAPFKADKHGRFEADQSIAFQYGFLKKPIVDIWSLKLWHELKGKHPDLTRQQKSYSFIPTVDVDSAFAYRSKGLVRTLGGIAKDLWARDLSNLGHRLRVVVTRTHDPYDTYDEFIDMHANQDVRGIFFFLMADYGHNDKNVPHSSLAFHKRIKHIADYHDVGIHPGYMSNSEPDRLPKEIKRLESIIRSSITRSRQHFLIQRYPETHRRLIDHGIEEDYSLGFASQIGFRAGTCTPYPVYDLETETITALTLYPFALMDSTLNFYMNLSPEDAVKEIAQMVDEVRKVDGTFISLWHNESLSEKWHWKGWSKVYQQLIELAR